MPALFWSDKLKKWVEKGAETIAEYAPDFVKDKPKKPIEFKEDSKELTEYNKGASERSKAKVKETATLENQAKTPEPEAKGAEKFFKLASDVINSEEVQDAYSRTLGDKYDENIEEKKKMARKRRKKGKLKWFERPEKEK